jgi:organic radical activating enzyme
MEYPIVETFFSIQGEGANVGAPVNFIRLAGCPVNCSFCDTDKRVKETVTEYQLASRMRKGFPVVITGGEPCIHNLSFLTDVLHAQGFKVLLETSGTQPITGLFEYIAVSPKKTSHFTKHAADEADEVKWLVPEWSLEEIKVLDEFFTRATHRYIQPVNDAFTVNRNNVQKAMQIATELNWPVSIQLHKVIGVR